MKPRHLSAMLLLVLSITTAQAQMRHFKASELPSADEVARLLGEGNKQATLNSDAATPDGVRTRGIRLTPDAPAANTVNHAAAPAPEASGFSFPVAFALGSANIAPHAYDALDRIGAGMRALMVNDPNAVIRLEGHADASGDPGANLVLSLRRALSVRTYLASRFGIAQDRFDVAGLGASALLNQANPYAAENRRVEFKRQDR